MPPILGPSWLPFPPSPETHQGRHIRRYLELLQDRENGTPRLHAGILIGKKRVHKRAVVRNRCKTRLMAALRSVVQHDPTLRVHSSTSHTLLIPPAHAYIFFGTANLYSANMIEIEHELKRALASAAAKLAPPRRTSVSAF